MGEPCYTIFMKEVTEKVYSKIAQYKQDEENELRENTENFTSTINHEMSTPLATSIFFMQQLQGLVNE